MKKTQLLAGMLAVTAGLALQSEVASAAASKKSEKQFPNEFILKSSQLVRTKAHDDRYSVGHLYIKLRQETLTPAFQNQLHGEMVGNFYFESDAEDATYSNGEKAKTYMSFAGDDGEILLDKTNKDADGSQYQVYGCNSTKTQCDATQYSIYFDKSQTVTLTSNQETAFEVWDEKTQSWSANNWFELSHQK